MCLKVQFEFFLLYVYNYYHRKKNGHICHSHKLTLCLLYASSTSFLWLPHITGSYQLEKQVWNPLSGKDYAVIFSVQCLTWPPCSRVGTLFFSWEGHKRRSLVCCAFFHISLRHSRAMLHHCTYLSVSGWAMEGRMNEQNVEESVIFFQSAAIGHIVFYPSWETAQNR